MRITDSVIQSVSRMQLPKPLEELEYDREDRALWIRLYAAARSIFECSTERAEVERWGAVVHQVIKVLADTDENRRSDWCLSDLSLRAAMICRLGISASGIASMRELEAALTAVLPLSQREAEQMLYIAHPGDLSAMKILRFAKNALRAVESLIDHPDFPRTEELKGWWSIYPRLP